MTWMIFNKNPKALQCSLKQKEGKKKTNAFGREKKKWNKNKKKNVIKKCYKLNEALSRDVQV